MVKASPWETSLSPTVLDVRYYFNKLTMAVDRIKIYKILKSKQKLGDSALMWKMLNFQHENNEKTYVGFGNDLKQLRNSNT